MADDIAALGIRIDSLQVEVAESRLDKMTKAGRGAEMQTSKLNTAWKLGATALGVLGVGTAALSATVAKSTRDWLEYDKAIKEVRSITGQTREEFEHFRKEVLDVSSAMGVDATTAARGLYEALSAGVPKENAIEFLAVASKTAVAGVTSVDTAVNGLTNVFNAFKIPVSEAEDVANKFLQTVNDGKTTFEQMSHSISEASVPMAAIGGTYEELFAQIGAITSLGTPTAQAFTQVKATINALLNPSDELVSLYKQMGVESGRAAVAQFGYAGTLNKIRDALDGNDTALVKALRSSEAFNGVLSTTGENAATVTKFFDNLGKASENLGGAYKTNADTLAVALTSLKNSATSLVETMESSYGVISTFTGMLKSAAMAIQALSNGSLFFSDTTNQLLAGGSSMGQSGAMLIKDRIDLLKQENALLEAQDSKKGSNQIGGSPSLGMMTGAGTIGPLGNGGSIEKNKKEIEALSAAYSKFSAVTKDAADRQKLLLENAGDPKAMSLIKQGMEDQRIAQEALNEAFGDSEKEQKAAAEAKTASALAAQKNAAIEIEAAEKLKEADKDRLELATRIGENQREKIEGQIKELELVRLTNGASAEQIRFADAGIAKLKEELGLLDEMGNKIPKAELVKGPKALKAGKVGELNVGQDFEAIWEQPTQNLFDELAKQEAEIVKSYQKRMRDILNLTDATEEQKAALIAQANHQLAASQDHFEKERYKASLSLSADYFGNLSTIAVAFGKKGHKIAQAAAIAETTINTYKSATAAYSALAGIPYIGPVLGGVAAGAAVAAGFVNIAKIRSTEYAGAFEGGGFVGGNSFSGDNMTASVNSGELILNRNQQKNLWETANGKGESKSNAPTIIVQNLPGQDVEITRSDDETIITMAVVRVENKLAKEARQGGGKVFPTFMSATGLKRKGQ